MKSLPNSWYDFLKWACLVAIPALSTLYVTLDTIFGWGYGDIVAKVSVAVCTCIGGLIGISTAQYNKEQ